MYEALEHVEEFQSDAMLNPLSWQDLSGLSFAAYFADQLPCVHRLGTFFAKIAVH